MLLSLSLLFRAAVWCVTLSASSQSPHLSMQTCQRSEGRLDGTTLGRRKLSLSTGCPSKKGVLRDYLLRRRWVLKFLGNKGERQLLRSLFSDPSRRTPCGQGQFFLS